MRHNTTLTLQHPGLSLRGAVSSLSLYLYSIILICPSEDILPARLLIFYLYTIMANSQTLSPDELAQIPPSVLNTLPALQPPAGVQPNFVNPENRGYIQTTVASVLFGLMVCLFANRIYTKLVVVRKLSWDDCKSALRHIDQIAMRLKIKQSVMHDWICRYPMLSSSSHSINSATAGFNCSLYRQYLG